MAAIEVHHLDKRFGPVRAVDDLSFEVATGSVTGFVGPNGAGKSTTLGCLVGLVRPDGGELLFEGVPYHHLSDPPGLVGAVLEATTFHPGRSARQHLRVLAAATACSSDRVEEVLELVGLGEAAARRVGGFSLGMRQRLGLAAALLARPRILVLDEPANGLDPEGVRWLRRLLRDHAAGGGTVLLSSHVIAELALSADHLVIIQGGRLAAQGTVAELTGGAAARHSVWIRTPEREKLSSSLAEAGIATELGPDGELVALGVPPEVVGRVVAESGVVVYELRMERPQLEDVVLELTRGREGT